MPIVVTTDFHPPPPPPGGAHVPLQHVWRGADGSVYDLTDLGGGKVVKLRGAHGYGRAPVAHWWSDTPALPGSIHRGSHDDQAELFVPVMVRGVDSADFIAEDDALARSMSADALGAYWVYTPDGSGRYAMCRYGDGLDQTITVDPVAAAWARYDLTLDRDDPYWRGEKLTYAFSGASLPVNTTGVKLIANPGEVPVWPKWMATGAYSGVFTFGVGSGAAAKLIRISPPNTIPPVSTTRIVDTDPRLDAVAVVDQLGADKWSDIVSWSFAPIPPGGSVEISIGVFSPTSSAALQLELVPAYRRAW